MDQFKGILKFLFLFFLYYQLIGRTGAALSASGRNVCWYWGYYTMYYGAQLTKSNPENYRACCGYFIWCTKYCDRVRYKKGTYYQQASRQSSRKIYHCCQGWAQSGAECTIPICSSGCKNGGSCISPGNCRCLSGFQGSSCQNDVKECSRRPSVCDQTCNELRGSYSCSCLRGYVKTLPNNPTDRKCSDANECNTNPCSCAVKNDRNCLATCINTVGSYRCSCKSGYQLLNGRICNDINECTSGRHNCDQICSNNYGSFDCSCNGGYQLLSDKRTCKDVNECSRINGGCNHICENTVGSYKCNCLSGYRLSNNLRTCIDIDECTERQPCDRVNGICTNLPGFYRCSCRRGYKLLVNKSCVDINECARNTTNNCQQICHNTIASYTCNCSSGYRLQTDKHNCADINECVEQSQCEHRCLNTIGSYICSCRSGYRLNKDNKTCTALPCVDISAPVNGNLSCNGYVTDKICRVTCDEGFNLHLETSQNPLQFYNRNCTADRTWSGEEPDCKEKECPALKGPNDGSVVEPCIEFFGSKCLSKCSKGFYLDGEDTNECQVKDGKTFWSPNNATCKAATPCQPNPCENGGLCIKLSHKTFKCDCSNTLYTGSKCEMGILQFDPISDLIVGKSLYVKVKGKPKYFVQITITSEPAGIRTNPPLVTIHGGSHETNFELSSLTKGKFTLKFNIEASGQSFRKIPDSIVFVRSEPIKINPVKMNTDFFNGGSCIKIPLISCLNGKTLNISTSCQEANEQSGFLNIHSSDDVNIPLVVSGLSMNQVSENRLIIPIVNDLLENRKISNPCTTCSKKQFLNTDVLNYVIKYGYFEKSILRKFSEQFIFGVSIDTKEPFSSEEMNYRTIFGRGDKLRTDKSLKCRNVDFQTSKWYSIYNPRIPITMQLLSIKKEIPKSDICFVYNLCDEEIQVSLSKESSVDLQNYFSETGLKGYKLKSSGFKVFKESQGICFNFDQLSDENCVQRNLEVQLYGDVSFGDDNRISIDGNVVMQLNKKAILSKLDEDVLLAYKGILRYSGEFMLFGKELKLDGDDDKGEIYCSLGGKDNKCPSCQSKGITMAFKGGRKSFTTEQNIINFIPKENKFIKVQIHYNAKGGTVFIGLASSKYLQRKLSRLISKVQSRFTNFLKAIQLSYPADHIIFEDFIQKHFNAASSLEKILRKQGHVYEEVFTAMKSLKLIGYDLTAALNAFLSRIQSTVPSIVHELVYHLKSYKNLHVDPQMKEIKIKNEGKLITYLGDICINRFCFHDVTTRISDFYDCYGSCLNNTDEGYIQVQAKTERGLKLSSNILLKQNRTLNLKISKYSKEFEGSLDAEVNIINQNLPMKIKFADREVHYTIDNLTMGDEKLSFQASGKIQGILTSWEDITHKMKGKSADHTALMKQMQSYFEETSKNINTRQENNRIHIQQATIRYRKQLEVTSKLKSAYTVNNAAYLRADADYRRTYSNYTNTEKSLKSYLDNEPILKAQIEKNVSSICPLKTCQAVCIPTQLCEVCQDKVELEVDSLKCDMGEEVKRETRLVPFDTKCEVVVRKFKNIYTGSCPLTPEDRRNGAIIGGAIGLLVGGPVGGLIGALVGFLGGLFSSCDRSYKVIEEKEYKQEPCTKLRSKTVSTRIPVSKCIPIKTSVSSGFSTPTRCNCRVENCGVRVSNESCVLYNQNCRRNRNLKAGLIKDIDPYFLNLQEALKGLEHLSNRQFIELEKAKKKRDISLKNYNHEKNLINLFKQKSLSANGSSHSFNVKFKKEICLANFFYTRAKLISEILQIEDVQFDLTLPVNDKIELQVKLKENSAQQIHIVPVLYSISDSNLSLKGAAKKILMKTLCPFKSRRRRREKTTNKTKEYDDDDLPFVNWFEHTGPNTTTHQKSCISSRTAFTLLRKIANITVKHINESIIAEKISREINISKYENSSSSNQKEILNLLKLDLEKFKNGLNASTVIEEIKQEAEIFIAVRNYSVCFNFDDCLNLALETLENVPSLHKESREKYLTRLIQLKAKLKKILSMPERHSLSKLFSTASSLQKYIVILESSSLQCADVPSIRRQSSNIVDIIEGTTFYTRCYAYSKLSTKFYWTKDNIVVDGATQGWLLIRNVSRDSTGIYKCHVFSPIGNDSSEGIYLNVVGPPRFYESIKKVDYFVFKNAVVQPQLTCNVTANPKPTVRWFFKQLHSTYYLLIRNDSSILLNVLRATKEKVGYYYCSAYNKYGRIQSRPIRFDILRVQVPDMELTISVKVGEEKDIKPLLAEYLQNSTNIKLIVTFKNSISTLRIYTNFKNKNETYNNESAILAKVTKLRQNIANTAAIFVNTIIKTNVTQNFTNKNDVKYNSKLDICQPGYKINDHGFMCVECPIGTYGENCKPCPRGTFQPMPGQPYCVKCPLGGFTRQEGSTHESMCSLFCECIIITIEK